MSYRIVITKSKDFEGNKMKTQTKQTIEERLSGVNETIVETGVRMTDTPDPVSCLRRAERFLVAGQKYLAAKEFLLAAAVSNPESYLVWCGTKRADRSARNRYLTEALQLFHELGDKAKIDLVEYALRTDNDTQVDSVWVEKQKEFFNMFRMENGQISNRLVDCYRGGTPERYHTIFADNNIRSAPRGYW
jgi:hypothetical protein